MIEHQVDILTPDGVMETFVCHPDRDGPHPAILFFMDAPGMREELRDMARRIASVGYVVILPNLYYRHGRNTVCDLAALAQENSPERARMFQLMASLTQPMLMRDADAMIAYARSLPDVAQGKMGAVGYCMSGPTVFALAGNRSETIGAAASIYGVSLLTEADDSPHLAADNISGEMYFACAETDQWAPLSMIDALRDHLGRINIRHEIEIYPKTHHGFAFPGRAVYDKAAAERHWVRLFALFARNLK